MTAKQLAYKELLYAQVEAYKAESNDKPCNGFVNSATWSVSLNLMQRSQSSEWIRAKIDNGDNLTPELMKERFEHFAPEDWCVGEVYWVEIADHYFED
jgi:hypothetical protein